MTKKELQTKAHQNKITRLSFMAVKPSWSIVITRTIFALLNSLLERDGQVLGLGGKCTDQGKDRIG